ncbi:MAG: TIGR04219 family outer membrane beta-barrel protein [Agarilytica sp.]
MKKLLSMISVIAVPAVLSSSAFAVDATPFFSVYAGAGSWSTSVSGDLGDSETDVDDLGLDDESNTYLYVAFEHAVPFVPQVRLEQSSVSTSGSETLTETFEFSGIDYELNADIDTEIELSFLDATLYYELFMFDFGLTFRQFDAELSAQGTDSLTDEVVTERESVDGVLPMLYAQTKIDLPFTGLYVTGAANFISVDDKSVADFRGALGYEIEIPVIAKIGLELGYRSFGIDLGEEEDFAGNIEFDGAYFGLNVKF